MAHDLFKIPNLISLGRLVFVIPAGYFLARPEPSARVWALVFLTVAALSDFLDGFLARRLNQQTRLGLILDPLSDKILAAAVVVLLLVYRDFPVWLAAVIIGRDLLIMIGGLLCRSKIHDIPASNLTGKYCFTAIAILLISHVIEFEFGIALFTALTLIYIFLSLVIYGRSLYMVIKERPVPVFRDRPVYKDLRISFNVAVSAVFLFKLVRWLGWW